jgi:hypothetical protein
MEQTYVWIYRTSTHMLMVKQAPFSYRTETSDPSTGLLYVNVVPGTCIPLPKWEWVKRQDGRVIAGLGDYVYDISDIL